MSVPKLPRMNALAQKNSLPFPWGSTFFRRVITITGERSGGLNLPWPKGHINVSAAPDGGAFRRAGRGACWRRLELGRLSLSPGNNNGADKRIDHEAYPSPAKDAEQS
jgi:hypothetical protein